MYGDGRLPHRTNPISTLSRDGSPTASLGMSAVDTQHLRTHTFRKKVPILSSCRRGEIQLYRAQKMENSSFEGRR